MLTTHLVGGFNPSEKYESKWEGLSHILWKIKNVFLTPRQRQLAEEVRSEASSINTTFMCETAKAAGQVLRPDQELAFWQTQR